MSARTETITTIRCDGWETDCDLQATSNEARIHALRRRLKAQEGWGERVVDRLLIDLCATHLAEYITHPPDPSRLIRSPGRPKKKP